MSSIHILHIEDDMSVATTVSRLLRKKLDAVVVSVASGEEAMSSMTLQNWNLIISDWNIKGKATGGDVFDWVREQFPELSKKYVFMSDDQQAAEYSAQYGLEFVEKPASVDRILQAVRTAGA